MPGRMPGMTWASLKKNPSLMPLYVFVGGGVFMAAAYVARIAIFSPEVSWTKANTEPWNYYADKTYKLHFSGEKPDVKKLAVINRPHYGSENHLAEEAKH